jgi:hypothetical protein
MLTLLRTDANLLNFAMANCIVSFVIGMALLHAGLYGKTGPQELADAEERLRHGALDRDRPVDDAARTDRSGARDSAAASGSGG